ncbi:MAG: hypothetical protein V3U80_06960, partial [Flavobacteriaceae bacterium]
TKNNNTMKQFTTTFLIITTLLFGVLGFGQQIMISQYIETTTGSIPKGIEIYNNSGEDIVFSAVNNLQVYKGANGAACANLPGAETTSGTLLAGEVWVIGTSNLTTFATTNGTDLSGTTDHNFSFNGDDALQVYLGSVLQDQFGQCGTDPGTHWTGSGGGNGTVSTKNNNISLRDDVCKGFTASGGWADPSLRFNDGPTGTDMTDFGTAPNRATSIYTAGAWDNGLPTSGTQHAIIDDNYNTSAGDINACDCTINATKTLTIPDGKYLNVVNSIFNDGTVIVEHQGSITQENDKATVTGTNFQIQKTTTPYNMYDYTYWSSPIENADMSLFPMTSYNYYFDTAVFEDVNGGAYPQSTAGSDTFDDNGDDWKTAIGPMTVAKGYIAMGAGAVFPYQTPTALPAQDVTFTGKINNGEYTIDVFSDQNLSDSFENQNLIGNPYPSAIDLKAFYNANKTTLVGGNPILTGTFNFWTHGTQIGSGVNTGPDAYNFTNADYAMATYDGTTLNLVAGGNALSAPEFITSGQGFFVDVEDAGTASANVGTLVFNNSMRVTGNNNNFLRPTTTTTNTADRVWLNMVTDNNTFRQILVGFFDNATDNVDRGIDGKRMFNGADYDFYSLLNNERYGIQGFPLLGNDKVVPLGITAPNTGDVTLSIDRFEGDLANVNIYIRDLQLNTLNDLKVSDYTFNMAQTGVLDTRFELVFSRSALSTNDTKLVDSNDLTVSNQNGNITFTMGSGKTITTIDGFDVLGKSIIQETAIASSNYTLTSNIDKGTIVIFKVTLENGQTLTKKFLKL